MSDGKTEQDPSMEEILASIRRIISEDAAVDDSPAEGDDLDNVLELTQMVQEDGSTVDLSQSEPTASSNAKTSSESVTEPEAEPDSEPEDNAVTNPDSGSKAKADEDPEPEPAVEPGGEPDPKPEAAAEIEGEPELKPEPESMPAPKGKRLVSDASAEASVQSFSELSSALEPEENSSPGLRVAESGRTVEDIVMELIKPMLREWLDNNLPPIVERLVKKEIRNLVRRSEPD